MGPETEALRVHAAGVDLDGELTVPDDAAGLVVFAHGSGSSRHSPRNQAVAAELVRGGFATYLFDLLTADEERVDRRTREYRFDIELLTPRLIGAIEHLRSQPPTRGLNVGVFGASTGAAIGLRAAARSDAIPAVVSRGGRPDLAGGELSQVTAPTLLIVGSRDEQVLELNRQAATQLATADVATVEGATHLFEEPGALERVTELARTWFTWHLR